MSKGQSDSCLGASASSTSGAVGGDWDGGLTATVVADLDSGSGLGSSFSALLGAGLTLLLVGVLLADGDLTVDLEFSLGNLTVLLGGLSVGDGLGNLGLVGDGVFVWDGDLGSADLGVGVGGFSAESGVTIGTVGGGWESGVGVHVSTHNLLGDETESWSGTGSFGLSSVVGRAVHLAVPFWLRGWYNWLSSSTSTSTVVLDGDGSGGSDEGNKGSEFHF